MHRFPRRWLAAIFTAAVALLAAIAAVTAAHDYESMVFTQDVTALVKIHPLIGLLSNAGVLLWCAAAVVSLFSAAVLWRQGDADWVPFLVASGILSAYLLLDDFFLIHDWLAQEYLGLEEPYVLIALLVAVGGYLFAFRHRILQTDYALLLLALILFAASMAIDTVFAAGMRRIGHWDYLVEDGAKWLGIVSWCAYQTSTSLEAVGAAMAQPRPTIVRWTAARDRRARAS